jgi:signal transduction histidine kinase/DNA-binding response OmpR family regulator
MPIETALADILVVDDQVHNLKVLTNLLSGKGYAVRPAMSGELALKAVTKKLPEIILLDILMPQMDGYEVCRQVKQNPQAAHIPILFLSALTNTEDKLKAFRNGGADYIVKPFQIEEVLARVETHLKLARMRQDREHLVFNLNERVKELSCLSTVTRAVHSLPNAAAMFKKVLEILPSGWLYPENTHARIVFDGQVYAEVDLPDTPWKQSIPLYVEGTIRGRLDVLFIGDSAQEPFIPEEQSLLENLARVLGEAVERCEVHHRLLNSEYRFHGLFEHMNSGVAIYRAENHGTNFILTDLNASGERIADLNKEDVIGKSLLDIFPAAHDNGMLDAFRRVWQSSDPEVMPDVHYQDERLDTWVENRVYKLPDGSLVVNFDDINQRKEAEAIIRQDKEVLTARVAERTRELEQANLQLRELAKLKDEFLASMSHELRSPLNAILGSTEILQEGVYGPLSDKQAHTLQSVYVSARHLLSLINDILDVSKVEAGKLDLDIHDISPFEICQSCLHLIKEMAQKKRLKIQTDFSSDVQVIQADARRLKQILLNLLSNAVKFTPEQGQIGLSFEGDSAQGVVVFQVWDTGIGIADNMMSKLFQPFVQLDSSLSRHYEGTGLGLALVKSLTDLHGGSVSVSSLINQGSLFSITLPWQPHVQETASSAEDKQPVTMANTPQVPPVKTDSDNKRASTSILLVEDNEHNRILLSNYLDARGYQVIVAADGAEALQHARNTTPDLILMDIQMPGIDGLEVTRRIRGELQMPNVPIIALTALAMPGDKERCLEAGADAYLSKPVAIRELMELAEKLLAGKEIF